MLGLLPPVTQESAQEEKEDAIEAKQDLAQELSDARV